MPLQLRDLQSQWPAVLLLSPHGPFPQQTVAKRYVYKTGNLWTYRCTAPVAHRCVVLRLPDDFLFLPTSRSLKFTQFGMIAPDAAASTCCLHVSSSWEPVHCCAALSSRPALSFSFLTADFCSLFSSLLLLSRQSMAPFHPRTSFASLDPLHPPRLPMPRHAVAPLHLPPSLPILPGLLPACLPALTRPPIPCPFDDAPLPSGLPDHRPRV